MESRRLRTGEEDLGTIMMMGEDLINRCCSLSMRSHHHHSYYLLDYHLPPPSSSSSSFAIFAFPGSWSADDWFAGEKPPPFGDSAVDDTSSLFPSLRSIGNDTTARVNSAFLRSFCRILGDSHLQSEVYRALAEKKGIVFTGHSSGGAVSVLATVWLLECLKRDNVKSLFPFCVTFGSPFVGDSVFRHALGREGWSGSFLHFVMQFDIVPRVLLSPLSSFKGELQAILQILCPKSLCFSLDFFGKSQLVTLLYGTVLRNAQSITSQRACLSMGNTNPLLEDLTSFIKISPYRPSGTYAFCLRNHRLVNVTNSEAILQLLFYCLQLGPEQEVTEAAQRSLKEHLDYESEVQNCLKSPNVVYLDNLEFVPLWLNDGSGNEMQSVKKVLEDLELSTEARLSLRAAGKWEKHRQRNQAKIDANFSKIQEAINHLNEYRTTCEIRGFCYYDAFKLQRENDDFNANVKRLELAGLWDEIVEMLRRYELPDSFESQADWVKLGTSYRHLVEPLDIANYYRHFKNEDTGPYMGMGRPKRYKYTQRWYEQAHRMNPGSASESCFWAKVEELCVETGGNQNAYGDMNGRILELEEEALKWFTSGELGRDVLLESSSFVRWWKSLPEQHRLESCIGKFLNGERNCAFFC